MADVLGNWVKLIPGQEKRLRFSGGGVQAREIVDPVTQKAKTVNSLHLSVVLEDGIPVSKSFSIVSERLASEMQAYLAPDKIVKYEFTFLKGNAAFAAPRLAKIEPIKT